MRVGGGLFEEAFRFGIVVEAKEVLTRVGKEQWVIGGLCEERDVEGRGLLRLLGVLVEMGQQAHEVWVGGCGGVEFFNKGNGVGGLALGGVGGGKLADQCRIGWMRG